jgi:hypothetical protein
VSKDHSDKTDREFLALLRDQFLMLADFAESNRIHKNGQRVSLREAVHAEATAAAEGINKQLALLAEPGAGG